MATLANINGRRIVQAIVAGKRRTIGIGRCADRDARAVRAHIAHLENAVASGLPTPTETARWLSTVSDKLHAKLAKAKLTAPRTPKVVAALGPYFDGYIARRTDLKPRTIENLKQTRRSVVNFFGPERDMATISRGEVKDWHRHESAKLAPATVSMHVKKIRQLYADAIDRNVLTENPFKAVKAGAMDNPARLVYVPAFDVAKVIDACPDHEWKLAFALARYEGMRVPSETKALRWADVLWDQGKLRIRSPKTEHHADKGVRVVPIFPEVLPYLMATHEQAEDGAVNVFVRLRGANLATTGDKLIERAGLTPWPKTWQNMRASCETDLVDTFPMHVACKWIGNSENVARKHYLIVKQHHFDQATRRAATGAVDSAGQHRTESGHETQKPTDAVGSAESAYPLGAYRFRLAAIEKLQSVESALQKALQTASDSDARSISKLTAAVHRAKAPPPPSAGRRGDA